ncbi:nuclear transport factor 2 family protein [Dictyobacter aurantiacus]|uniref:nuclear transport factor 2 family protein n=1 Tax=Dictyobacter aurantiacus TaxID=1936993 RepID=UPI00267815E2
MHAEKQLQQAIVNNDVPALERIIHDDLVFIDVEGNVQGKPLEAFCRYLCCKLYGCCNQLVCST